MSIWTIALNDQAVPTNATDTLANVKSMFELPAPANQPLVVTELDVTFDGTTSTNKPILLQVCLATATGTFPSSNLTPQAGSIDANAASTLVTAANIKYGTATVEGTVTSGNGFRLWRLPPTSGLVQQLPLGRGIYVPKGQFLRLRAVAVNAVNLTFNLDWNESGQ